MNIVPRLLPGDHWEGRQGNPIQAIVMHITDGETAAGAFSHWLRPDVDASAHYVVDKDGVIFQAVLEEDAAWANGVVNKPDMSNDLVRYWVNSGVNPNLRTISIELVGKPGRPIPAAEWAAAKWLVRDIHRRRPQITMTRACVIGHYQIDSVNRARCPSLTDAQWADLLGGGMQETNPYWGQVGDGIKAALKANGDEPLGPEKHLTPKGEDDSALSRAPGRKGLYLAAPDGNGTWRVGFVAWR